MWRGRCIIICALLLAAGNLAAGALPFAPEQYLQFSIACGVTSLVLALLGAWLRRFFILFSAIFMLGASSLACHRAAPPSSPGALQAAAGRAQQRFSLYIDKMAATMDADELAVFKAMAIGDKRNISRSLKEDYRRSGAMHLLALSGLHVGMIYALLQALLSIFGGSKAAKMIRRIVILAFLWTFALISGLSPSIFRAVLMLSFYELSDCVGGGRDGPSSTAISAIVIMLLDCEAIRDIGFQLSFSAMAGIFLIFPWLSLLLKTRSRLLRYVWQTMCMSISCQASCGVVAYLYFGSFPRYFLLSNLIAIPMATAVMYSIVLSLATSFIPGAGVITSGVVRAVIHSLNNAIHLLAGLD